MIESPNISRIQERDSDPIINRETGERNSLFYTFLEASKDIEIIQDDLDLTSADMVFTKIDMDTADEIKKACGRNTPVGYLIFFKAIEQARTLLERKIKDIEKGSDKDLFEETRIKILFFLREFRIFYLYLKFFQSQKNAINIFRPQKHNISTNFHANFGFLADLGQAYETIVNELIKNIATSATEAMQNKKNNELVLWNIKNESQSDDLLIEKLRLIIDNISEGSFAWNFADTFIDLAKTITSRINAMHRILQRASNDIKNRYYAKANKSPDEYAFFSMILENPYEFIKEKTIRASNTNIQNIQNIDKKIYDCLGEDKNLLFIFPFSVSGEKGFFSDFKDEKESTCSCVPIFFMEKETLKKTDKSNGYYSNFFDYLILNKILEQVKIESNFTSENIKELTKRFALIDNFILFCSANKIKRGKNIQKILSKSYEGANNYGILYAKKTIKEQEKASIIYDIITDGYISKYMNSQETANKIYNIIKRASELFYRADKEKILHLPELEYQYSNEKIEEDNSIGFQVKTIIKQLKDNVFKDKFCYDTYDYLIDRDAKRASELNNDENFCGVKKSFVNAGFKAVLEQVFKLQDDLEKKSK